ncbi:MAG: cation:proton antiporter [Candidatus Aenigmarchaeota archaeon]|nr:cation:proton antiporter [Candidatus Aenigmarchaeota archaeon]
MQLIIALSICILVSYLFVILSRKLNLSSIIGMFFAGLFLGITALRNILLEPNSVFISHLGEMGLVFLMFIAGLEISWREFCIEEKEAGYISIFATITPFLLAFLIFISLDFSFSSAIIIGICMSITAEATKAKELLDLKKIKSRVGSLMMVSGIIDDLIGMTFFIISVYWFSGKLILQESFVFFCAIMFFFIGIFVHKYIGRKTHIVHVLEKIAMFGIIPFFFITTGLNFSMASIAFNPALFGLILVIAISGKIIGVLFAKPFVNLSLKQIHLVGWAMNSRGAIELGLVFIAFKFELIDVNIYSALVLTALVTTLIFPFIIKKMIKSDPKIMD